MTELADLLAVLTEEVNSSHGAGPRCGVAFDVETYDRLPGLVAAGAVIEGYKVLPARERWDDTYSMKEVEEALA